MGTPPLVTADWLLDRLGQQGLVVVDCRWALRSPDAGRRAWEEAHIPGAHFLDVEEDLSGRPGSGSVRILVLDTNHDDSYQFRAQAGYEWSITQDFTLVPTVRFFQAREIAKIYAASPAMASTFFPPFISATTVG